MTTTAQKVEYNEIVAPIKTLNESLAKYSNEYLAKLNSDGISQNPIEFAKSKIIYIRITLQEVSNLIQISRISLEKLAIKNETVLNQARKKLYVIIQSFEEIVGNEINVPLNNSKEQLIPFEKEIDNFDRFNLFKQIGFFIDTVKNIYTDNTKWKWSFIELEGRMVTAMKNFIDLSKLIHDLDPSTKDFADRMEIINLIMGKTNKVAISYRNKYELTNKRIDDMNTALAFLSFGKRLALLLGDQETAKNCKKKFDIWNKKLNEDIKLSENNNNI